MLECLVSFYASLGEAETPIRVLAVSTLGHNC
jgi:hypothetical protein